MKEKLVSYDHQTFIYQRYGGISRLFSEIMQYLYDQNVPFYFPLEETSNYNLRNKKFFTGKFIELEKQNLPPIETWLVPFPFPGKGKFYSLVSTFYTINKKIKKDKLIKKYKKKIIELLSSSKEIIFHPTYYEDYYLDTILNKSSVRLVLTIHDLIHEKFPGYFSLKDMVLENRKKLIDRANKIICVSENTKKDLINYYNIEPSKISVVYHGYELVKQKSAINPIFKDYILYVGDRWAYKNFRNFLYSVAPIVKQHKCLVVCAGFHPFHPHESHLMEELGIQGKVIHYRFEKDGELASLYANAKLFVFPSLYEGFGIPLLEAMSLGCPVVCSNTSSFPEVVGNAAEMFDPWNIESMTHSIQKVLESDSLRKELIQKGKERINQFSWEKCGKEHLEVYKSLF